MENYLHCLAITSIKLSIWYISRYCLAESDCCAVYVQNSLFWLHLLCTFSLTCDTFLCFRYWNILCTNSWFQGYLASNDDPHCSRGRMFCTICQPVLQEEGLPTSPRVCLFGHGRRPHTRFCCLCWRQCHYITIGNCFGWSQLWWGGTDFCRSRCVNYHFQLKLLYFYMPSNFILTNACQRE